MEAIETDEVVPTNHVERVEAVSQLIRGDSDAVESSKEASTDSRDAVEEQNAIGDGSGSSELVQPERDDLPGVQDDTEAEQTSDNDEPVTLKGLATHLDIEPGELYELEIPIADGETVSLGQLKDEYKKYGDAAQRESTLKEADDKYHRQVLATRAELNSIMSVIPENIRAQVIQQGQLAQAQWTKDQEAQVLETIPGWQDADTRAADRDAIVSLGAEYGFTAPEMTYTQDARTLLMLKEFAQARKDIADMKASAKRVKGQPSQVGKTRSTTQTKRRLAASLSKAKESRHIGDKVSVVSQLIRGK